MLRIGLYIIAFFFSLAVNSSVRNTAGENGDMYNLSSAVCEQYESDCIADAEPYNSLVTPQNNNINSVQRNTSYCKLKVPARRDLRSCVAFVRHGEIPLYGIFSAVLNFSNRCVAIGANEPHTQFVRLRKFII